MSTVDDLRAYIATIDDDDPALIANTIFWLAARLDSSTPESAVDPRHATVGLVDVLGKLVDRLPDALTLAEFFVVLDRLNITLSGHHDSSSVDAPGAVSPGAGEPIVEATTGAAATSSSSGPVVNITKRTGMKLRLVLEGNPSNEQHQLLQQQIGRVHPLQQVKVSPLHLGVEDMTRLEYVEQLLDALLHVLTTGVPAKITFTHDDSSSVDASGAVSPGAGDPIVEATTGAAATSSSSGPVVNINIADHATADDVARAAATATMRGINGDGS